jgi:hypothetical protein
MEPLNNLGARLRGMAEHYHSGLLVAVGYALEVASKPSGPHSICFQHYPVCFQQPAVHESGYVGTSLGFLLLPLPYPN